MTHTPANKLGVARGVGSPAMAWWIRSGQMLIPSPTTIRRYVALSRYRRNVDTSVMTDSLQWMVRGDLLQARVRALRLLQSADALASCEPHAMKSEPAPMSHRPG